MKMCDEYATIDRTHNSLNYRNRTDPVQCIFRYGFMKEGEFELSTFSVVKKAWGRKERGIWEPKGKSSKSEESEWRDFTELKEIHGGKDGYVS